MGRLTSHSAERSAARIRRELAAAETVVVSVPKAGRSWACYFLARYVAELTGDQLDLDLLSPNPALPAVAFVHEHIDVFEDEPAPVRLLNEDLLLRRRLVVLARDPRDSLVSWWHHKRAREGRPVPARLELFADCPTYGIERLSQSTALLLDLFDRHPGDKLLITYEGLIADPERGLTELLRFALNGRPADERCRRAALALSGFERMRQWERGLSTEDCAARYEDRFGPRFGGASDDAHFKVRRGKVGAFRSEMSHELQRHVASLPHTEALVIRLAGLVP